VAKLARAEKGLQESPQVDIFRSRFNFRDPSIAILNSIPGELWQDERPPISGEGIAIHLMDEISPGNFNDPTAAIASAPASAAALSYPYAPDVPQPESADAQMETWKVVAIGVAAVAAVAFLASRVGGLKSVTV
jgi:hypothetical protein